MIFELRQLDGPLFQTGGAHTADCAADPLLRLPAGRWELRVGVVGQLAECTQNAPSLDLDLPPIVLEVR